MIARRRAAAASAALAVTILLAACAPVSPVGKPPTAGPDVSTTTAVPAPASAGTAATAVVPHVDVYAAPDGGVTAGFDNPQPTGAPLTFLVEESRAGWLRVELPQRPNESTGWISAASVSLHRLEYSLRVSTENNTLTLLKLDAVVKEYPVATGTGGTPTPHGSFYLTELLAPSNPGYGPYAFGLSAFSDVLSSFGGGPGQIGLHGTDDAASIGSAASHGCVRMTNDDITALAQLLPLGTPITIE
jgi:lipoprotein-anchoring transpeptidase ErfK/SrfK